MGKVKSIINKLKSHEISAFATAGCVIFKSDLWSATVSYCTMNLLKREQEKNFCRYEVSVRVWLNEGLQQRNAETSGRRLV